MGTFYGRRLHSCGAPEPAAALDLAEELPLARIFLLFLNVYPYDFINTTPYITTIITTTTTLILAL